MAPFNSSIIKLKESAIIENKNTDISIKPPCSKCPYTLGLIYVVINPCPQCKLNEYQSYEQFRSRFQEGILLLEMAADKMNIDLSLETGTHL